MSAEVLREAARLMRGRVEAATPGPWECFGDHLVWPGEKGPAANDPIAGFGPAHEDTAPHIASWHPDVALAVADLLDKAADTDECARSYGKQGVAPDDPAMTLATTYLGTNHTHPRSTT